MDGKGDGKHAEARTTALSVDLFDRLEPTGLCEASSHGGDSGHMPAHCGYRRRPTRKDATTPSPGHWSTNPTFQSKAVIYSPSLDTPLPQHCDTSLSSISLDPRHSTTAACCRLAAGLARLQQLASHARGSTTVSARGNAILNKSPSTTFSCRAPSTL
ncbi:hypothetical protein MRB53_042351 [Persea americana]|nr:hypothetical protein MRB53_042351 [Persea americana]